MICRPFERVEEDSLPRLYEAQMTPGDSRSCSRERSNSTRPVIRLSYDGPVVVAARRRRAPRAARLRRASRQAARRSASACAASRASTITRSTGSVPEARISTRPVVAELALDLGCALGQRARSPSSRCPACSRTLISVCGNSVTPASSSRQRSARCARSACSTCRALTMPSPVVCLSSASRWPEPSPPSSQPRFAQLLEHVAVADLGAHELDAAARAAPARRPCWSSACRPRPAPARRASRRSAAIT